MSAQPVADYDAISFPGAEPVDVDKPTDDDQSFWSVTTLLKSISNDALLYWAAEQTAISAVRQQATWRGMLEDDSPNCDHAHAADCDTVKWLRDARFRRKVDMLSDADLGSAIHALCETYALTGIKPDQQQIRDQILTRNRNADLHIDGPILQDMLNQFDQWAQKFQPAYQAAEVTVYHPDYGYAGTADGFLTVDGYRAIIDYKSTRNPYDGKGNPKTPYPEVALQLAAYRHAQFAAVWQARRHEKFRRRYYLLSTEERERAVPVPEVDGGLVIHITAIGCKSYPVKCGPDIYESFLYTIESARWLHEISKHVIGAPLEPTGAAA